MNKRAISVLVIVWLAFLFSMIDRMNFPPIIPVVTQVLGMNAKQAASYMTIFYIGYVITQLPGGYLSDRFGYRKVLLGAFLCMGIFSFSTGFIQNYGQGVIIRFLVGLSSGVIFSSSVAAIYDWFPPKGRGTAMGFFVTATSLGVSVVNLFVPGVASAYGWQYAFFVSGSLPIAGLIFAYFFLKENPNKEFREEIKAAQIKSSFFGDMAIIVKNRNVLWVGLAGFFLMSASWGTSIWANTYMNKILKLSLVQAGFFVALLGICGLLSKPISGFVSDLVGGKRKIVAFCMAAILGPALLWFGVNTSVTMLYILIPILGIGAFAYTPPLTALQAELVEPRLVGTATGLTNAMWQLGSAAAPYVVGAIIDKTQNYYYAFVTLAVSAIIAAIILLFIKEGRQKSEDKEMTQTPEVLNECLQIK